MVTGLNMLGRSLFRLHALSFRRKLQGNSAGSAATQNLRLFAHVTSSRPASDTPASVEKNAASVEEKAGSFNRTVRSLLESSISTDDPSSIVKCYASYQLADKDRFLRLLASEYGVNHRAVLERAGHLTSSANGIGAGEITPSDENALDMEIIRKQEERLRQDLLPRYRHIFLSIGRTVNGVKFLVDMRADVLTVLAGIGPGLSSELSHLHALSGTLRELLTLWFNVGFLQLQRITWDSSCDILQKISDYEAVHPIRNWTDLKRRVGPYRRCYVFTHGSMPKEPVVVLHTALCPEISNSIQAIVQKPKQPGAEFSPLPSTEDPQNIKSAVFYSITSTQRGLGGIEMGNYLIKRAVREVQSEFPCLSEFSSLSPIPGFREWLISEINKLIQLKDMGELPSESAPSLFSWSQLESISKNLCCHVDVSLKEVRQSLLNNSWVQSEALTNSLRDPIMAAAARYLYTEKRRGYALNPVANFHLKNGATMWRINWLADCSPKGLTASCGVMINYRYFLELTESNCISYQSEKRIDASDAVLQLLPVSPTAAADNKP